MTVDIDPVIGRLGPFTFGWYGIIMAAGILLGLWIVSRELKQRGLDPYHVLGIAACALPCGIVGARLVHVLENAGYFADHPAEIFGLSMVGLAVYGVMGGALLGGVLYALARRLPVLRVLDCGAIAFPVAQLIGKTANIINGDTWGLTTDLPWGITYTNPDSYVPDALLGVATHPTPIYEQLWLAIVIAAIVLCRRYLRRADGLAILSYAWLYSIGRFFLSFFRSNAAVLWGLKEAQVIALAAVIVVPVLAYWVVRRAKKLQSKESAEARAVDSTP